MTSMASRFFSFLDFLVRHGDAYDDQWIETVECPKHALHAAAPLGRIRIDVGEGSKALGHRRLAMHGDGVARLR